MVYLFRLDLAQQYIWGLVWAGLSMVPPVVVFKLIQFAQDLTTYNRNEALFYVAALLASIIVRSAGKVSTVLKIYRPLGFLLGLSSRDADVTS